jgi:hypothetical protein
MIPLKRGVADFHKCIHRMYDRPVRGSDANITPRMRPSECLGLTPRFHHDPRLCTGFVGALACWNAMEELLEFLFGASGRIKRAK